MKQDVMQEISVQLSALGLPALDSAKTDLAIDAELLDAAVLGGKKKLKYEAMILLDEGDMGGIGAGGGDDAPGSQPLRIEAIPFEPFPGRLEQPDLGKGSRGGRNATRHRRRIRQVRAVARHSHVHGWHVVLPHHPSHPECRLVRAKARARSGPLKPSMRHVSV